MIDAISYGVALVFGVGLPIFIIKRRSYPSGYYYKFFLLFMFLVLFLLNSIFILMLFDKLLGIIGHGFSDFLLVKCVFYIFSILLIDKILAKLSKRREKSP